MSGNAHWEQLGQPVRGPSAPVVQAADPATACVPNAVECAKQYAPARRWAEVPAENFIAWNALRLTEYAHLILKTHVPDGTTLARVLHPWVPALRLPALRCLGCPEMPPWPCPFVDWASGWTKHLPEIVEVAERRGGLADDVSRPVAVGDVQVQAATWDTPARGKEVA